MACKTVLQDTAGGGNREQGTGNRLPSGGRSGMLGPGGRWSKYMARDYRELIAWRKAMDLAKAVYRVTEAMPVAERYGLTRQILRAAVSVASNIAEGNARQTRTDYVRFLTIARGSLAELDTQMRLAEELGMLKPDQQVSELAAEVARLLQGLISRLKRAD